MSRAATLLASIVVIAVPACSPVGSAPEHAGATSTPGASRAAHSEQASTPPDSPTPRPPLAGAVIVVDPGHNGGNASHLDRISRPVNAGGFTKQCNTTGTATNAGYAEHAFNFSVATKLAKRLRADGAKVVLTRHDDHGVGPCVNQRGQVAADHHADLLLSVHGDGAASNAHGFTVLRPAKVSGYTAKTYKRSRRLAHAVAHAMAGHGFDRGTYLGDQGIDVRDDLGTLNRAETPAVMVEAGNMRNPHDARVMSSASGRARIARALAAGVSGYLRQR